MEDNRPYPEYFDETESAGYMVAYIVLLMCLFIGFCIGAITGWIIWG